MLNFNSESHIGNKTLDSIKPKLVHRDYKSIKEETQHIESVLKDIGYLESEINKIQKINDSTFSVNYYLGKKTKIVKIYYSSENFKKGIPLTDLENTTSDYFIIKFSEIKKALSKIKASQVLDGNSFAKVSLENLNKKGDTIIAELKINKGGIRRIDSIVIKGYDKFPISFIKYYSGIKTNKKFNLEQIIRKSKKLDDLTFNEITKPPEVLFEKERTTVYLYLNKQTNNNFDGILGFASKEDGNGIELNGYLNLELNNNLNYGEQLSIKYKGDGEGQRNINIKTTLPYILKTPIGLSLELKLFRRDSTFSTNEQKINILYQAIPSTTVSGGFRGNKSSDLNGNEAQINTIEDYSARFGSLGLEYTKNQNSTLFKIKRKINFEIEQGVRETNIFQDNQTRVQNHIFNIINLNEKNSIYLKNSTSILISNQYLTNELYRFGGINSIRGFSENSIDASLFSILNTEYRFLLNNNTYIHSIIDLGYFENKVILQKEKIYSFGVGLGLQTKAGLFSLNFANGNIENQDFKFSNSKIHFSLVTSF